MARVYSMRGSCSPQEMKKQSSRQHAGDVGLEVEVRGSVDAAEHARRKDTDICEDTRLAQTDEERLAATHGQAAHGTMLGIGFHAESGLDERNDAAEKFHAVRLHAFPAVST